MPNGFSLLGSAIIPGKTSLRLSGKISIRFCMTRASAIIVSLVCNFVLSLAADAQVLEGNEWSVPWTIIGDSTLTPDRSARLVLTGKITHKDTGLPVSGASVSVDFFKHYDYSDENGNYLLEIPPGNYRIKVKQLGMLPVYLRVKMFSNGALDVQMQEGAVQLTTILITSRPIDSNVKGSLPGLTKMNVEEVKTLPTLMGEVDIVKSLQLMPGVSSVGEGSSGINVRGGRVDQNLVLMNGVPLFNTAHALGFVSAFNQDLIQSFSLYKGNVPANLGGRASSVIEIETRRGNFESWKIQGGAGPISSRFTVEGPVLNKKSSLLLSGRISHANWFLKKVNDPDVSSSNVSFNDSYLGFSHRLNENSTAEVTFYSSHDTFRFSDRFGYRWNNYILNARWQSRADRQLSPTLSASYGHFKNLLFQPSGVDAMEITNTMDYFQLKETLHYIPSEHHDIKAGIAAIAYLPGDETRAGYRGNPFITARKSGKSSGLEWAVFLNDDLQLNESVSISAGLRYARYYHVGPDTVYRYRERKARTVAALTDTSFYSTNEIISAYGGVEPRISMRINLAENRSIKMSYNRMRQYIHLISNSTAPTPIDLWQVSNEFLPPQVADNFSVGYFLNIKDNRWETSVEFFYKRMDNLVEYKDFPDLFLNDHLETELLSGSGRARGAELFVRRLKGRWTGWLSYTYSITELMVSSPLESESINGGRWFPSNYNKPHTMNLVLNKHMRGQSAFSMIFAFNSGRPFTAIESSYISGGTVVPVYSDRNKHDIPNYFRMDLSFTIGSIINQFDDSLVFSVYNLLGRNNAYSVFYQRPASNFLIPKPYKLSVLGAALPSLTYNFRF